MKICMVSDVYYPYVGGIPEHIYHLSQELRKRGHIVKTLTSNFGGTTVETLKHCPDEENVHRVGKALLVRANKSFSRLPYGWRLLNQVKNFFDQEKFDVVHIHGTLAPTLPVIAIRQSRAVNVFTIHSFNPKSKGYMMFRWLLMPYFRKLDGVIAVSAAARDATMRFFPGKYEIIPNAIDIDLFNPLVESLPDFNADRPKILFLGRLEPRKGLKYLLQALPYIKKEFPNVLLIVVGAGLWGYSYKEYVDKEVAENIHFAGLISNEARPHYYSTCNVFCAPSVDNESFGIILLEAMATGKPIVASDISGYRTVLENGKHGYLVPPRDYEAIGTAIIKILRNPQLAQKMGEAGRVKALKFSWARIAEQVEIYYEKLLAPRFHRPWPVPTPDQPISKVSEKDKSDFKEPIKPNKEKPNSSLSKSLRI